MSDGLEREFQCAKQTGPDSSRGPYLPIIPHLPLECSCALLPGPAGDYTRAKMDALSEEYDTAVHAIIKQWNEEGDPGFGARW